MVSRGGIELVRIGNSSIRLIDRAAGANTEQNREMIANQVRQSLGHEGALLIETLPGGLLSGKAGAELRRRYGLGAGLANWGQGVEAWQRKALGDLATYRRPVTDQSPAARALMDRVMANLTVPGAQV
jgi:hypothetical protein